MPTPGIYADSPVDEDNLPQVGQKALQSLLAQWIPLWSDPAKAACKPQDWDIGADALPAITLDELNGVLNKSRADAGLGKERLHPRTILLLSDDYKLRLIDLFYAWENSPTKSANLLTLIIFLDKATGGVRPIGLTCFLLYLWSKLRRPVRLLL